MQVMLIAKSISNSTKPTFLNDKMDLFCFNYIPESVNFC